ncbi:MAG TPA: cytochrome C [Prolixibacteraceae bacterium]|nr:cytochrome C [Prolixibacteraceae bacterium]HCU61314.1 cytochrome C [Prolixibacteraceae bacterium]
MNIRKYKSSFFFVPALWLLVFFVLSACDHNRKTTGWEYFDDMAHSPAYESYTPNPNFADGKTMQATVEGTIPRGFMPYPYEKTDEDRVKAGENMKNPFEVNEKNMERGKKVFTIYCSSCHGDMGDGKGRLYTSGKYPFPPANLLSDKIRNNPEGEIYHVISVGFGVMAEHGSMISPDDRWKAVMYIKNKLHQ